VSFDAALRDATLKYVRLSKIEAKILDNLVNTKSGNAYVLWKKSGLKHYPTVLRTLKKLQEKNLVEVLKESGLRGERIYAPTLRGTLVSYLFRSEEKKILEMVAKHSSLYRELYKVDKDPTWAFLVAREVILAQKMRTRFSFDEAVKDRVESAIIDSVTDEVFNRVKGETDWIVELSKVKWVRDLAMRWIETERARVREAMTDLDKLERRLTK